MHPAFKEAFLKGSEPVYGYRNRLSGTYQQCLEKALEELHKHDVVSALPTTAAIIWMG